MIVFNVLFLTLSVIPVDGLFPKMGKNKNGRITASTGFRPRGCQRRQRIFWVDPKCISNEWYKYIKGNDTIPMEEVT